MEKNVTEFSMNSYISLYPWSRNDGVSSSNGPDLCSPSFSEG